MDTIIKAGVKQLVKQLVRLLLSFFKNYKFLVTPIIATIAPKPLHPIEEITVEETVEDLAINGQRIAS